jgi:hypothetical protein
MVGTDKERSMVVKSIVREDINLGERIYRHRFVTRFAKSTRGSDGSVPPAATSTLRGHIPVLVLHCKIVANT